MYYVCIHTHGRSPNRRMGDSIGASIIGVGCQGLVDQIDELNHSA
jgi:hypothetical protein